MGKSNSRQRESKCKGPEARTQTWESADDMQERARVC